MEHYGALCDIMGRYEALTERYGTVTENIDFANHQLILNFAHH